MTPSATSPVLVRRQGHLGRITLNRPKAVNALTPAMVALIADALDRWETDDRVACVLIDGAGDRGLCAGGDVRSNDTDPEPFLRAEFRLNASIAAYPKPYIAWMDGITMGGGVGLSAHGSLRIVTERSRVAMPETRIALSPDVGGTFLLSRASGLLGLHLALTSGVMTGADAIAAGFADLLLPSGERETLAAALAEGTDPREAAAGLALEPGRSTLLESREWIDSCYSADTLTEVLQRLRDVGGAAAVAADTIAGFSPTATAVAFAAIRRAVGLGLHDCLSTELVIMLALGRRGDVAEGIRVTLVDRTSVPIWNPARLDEVDLASVEALVGLSPEPPLW